MAVGTALAIGSAVAGATSTGLSIGQAVKQNRLKKEADAKATQAMADARKRLEVNYMDQLSIAKEPYRLAREAALSTAAQGIEAVREGDVRGMTTIGKIVGKQNQAQQQIASSMEQELARLDALSAQEDADIANTLAGLDVSTAKSAQRASRDALIAKNAAIGNAIKSGASTLTGAIKDFVPLYAQNKTAKDQFANIQRTQELGMETMPVSGGNQLAPIQNNQLAAPQYYQPNGYTYSEFPAGPLQQMPQVTGPSINPFNFQSPQIMQLNQPTLQQMLDRNDYFRAYQQGINL